MKYNPVIYLKQDDKWKKVEKVEVLRSESTTELAFKYMSEPDWVSEEKNVIVTKTNEGYELTLSPAFEDGKPNVIPVELEVWFGQNGYAVDTYSCRCLFPKDALAFNVNKVHYYFADESAGLMYDNLPILTVKRKVNHIEFDGYRNGIELDFKQALHFAENLKAWLELVINGEIK